MDTRGRKPADFANRIAAVTGRDGALSTVRDMGEAMDMPMVAIIENLSSTDAPTGYRRDQPIFESSIPPRFRETWNRRQYRLNNPVYLACRTEAVPFIWRSDSDGWSIPLTIDAAQRRILNYSAKFGMTGGICVPMHAPRGHVGCIVFIASAKRDFESILTRWRSALIVVGVYYMRAHALPIGQGALDGLRHLTRQEVACVTLAARGMTDKQIALELRIVPGTARFHMDNAGRKLNGQSRTQTVAIAAQLGLIGSVT